MANFRDLIKQNGGGVYSPSNKPTPADLGAVNKAGDTMTGDLLISKSIPKLKLHNTSNDGAKIEFNTNIEGQSTSIEHKISDGSLPQAGQALFVKSAHPDHPVHVSVEGEIFAKNNQKVYHTGNKPSPSTLGVYSKSESDGRYLAKTAKAADSNLLDGLDSSKFLRGDTSDTFAGSLTSGTRNGGVFGVYDSNKVDHIWSMGTAYKIHESGTNFGNLYGLAYKHTNNTTGGTMAGGHQMVWCTNGSPKAALGDNGVWTAGYTQSGLKTIGLTSFVTSDTPDYIIIKSPDAWSAATMPVLEIHGRALGSNGYTNGVKIMLGNYYYNSGVYQPKASVWSASGNFSRTIYVVNIDNKRCFAIPAGYCANLNVTLHSSSGNYGTTPKGWSCVAMTTAQVEALTKTAVPTSKVIVHDNAAFSQPVYIGTSGSTPDATTGTYKKGLTIVGGNQRMVIDTSNTTNGGGYIQMRHQAETYPSSYYTLKLNPLGGNVEVGGGSFITNGSASIRGACAVDGDLTIVGSNRLRYSIPDHSTNATWYYPIWHNGDTHQYTSKSKLMFKPSEGRFKSSTFESNNWFRSTGGSGWFNESHGGGIHMEDSTWVRVYNGKKFYVSNSDNDAILSNGGVSAKTKFNINGLTGSNKQAIGYTANTLYFGNQSLDNVYLETKSSGEHYVRKGTGNYKIYHEGNKPHVIRSSDTRNDNRNPNAQLDNYAFARFDFKSNSADGYAQGGTYHGVMSFRPYGSNTDTSGGGVHQLAFGQNNRLGVRYGTTSWGSWAYLYSTAHKPTHSDVGALQRVESSGHLVAPEGKWFRAASTSTGFLPNTYGTSGQSYLGTSSWYFKEAWVANYRGTTVNVSGEVHSKGTRIARTYKGTSAPSTSTGVDGDVYLRYK